jgi:hypothetical protein
MKFQFIEKFYESLGWDEEDPDDPTTVAPDLEELPQTSDDQMAFGVVEDSGKPDGAAVLTQVMPWVHCREYFNDYLFYHFADKHEGTIYGFDPAYYDIYPESLVLLVKVPLNANNYVRPIEESISELESTYGCNSFIHVVSDTIIMVDFDRKWINNPVLFSLFTREIRWGVLLWQRSYNYSLKYSVERLCSSEHGTNFYQDPGCYSRRIPADPLNADTIPLVRDLFSISTMEITEKYMRNGESEYRFHNFGFCKYLQCEHKQIVRDSDSGS